MKTLLKTNVILLLGIVALWGCEEDVTPLQHTAPQVTFPVQETSLTAVVGDPVEFRADIESGDKLTCGWYVDGTLEASIDPVIAERDACRIEHVISKETFERLKAARKLSEKAVISSDES